MILKIIITEQCNNNNLLLTDEQISLTNIMARVLKRNEQIILTDFLGNLVTPLARCRQCNARSLCDQHWQQYNHDVITKIDQFLRLINRSL